MTSLVHMIAALLTLALWSAALSGQLSGTYTCANGNPGNAFDYGDIGDFFDALEAQGVSGPVTLDVYDVGGPFVSNPSYALGVSPTPTTGTIETPVAGLSASNPLTIRAAQGQHPIITGVAQLPNWYETFGNLTFFEIGFTTIEGLVVRNSPGYGINWIALNAPTSNVRIARCRVHNVASSGLRFLGFSTTARLDTVVIENNMLWHCQQSPITQGVISIVNPGIEWIVQHNTVVHLQGPQIVCLLQVNTYASPIEELTGNVFYSDGAVLFCIANSSFANQVQFADYNIYRFGAGSQFNTGGDFAAWQTAGYDLNGMIADPLLVNVTPGQEDLRLSSASPARNFVAAPTVGVDIDLKPRPAGPMRDAGAYEFRRPEIVVEYAASPAAHGGTLNLGSVADTGAAFNFTVRNSGFDPLDLSGNPPVLLTPGANCAPATGVTSQPSMLSLTGTASTTFTLFVQAAVPGALDFTVSIASSDPLQSLFTFTVNAQGLPPPPPNLPAQAMPGAGSAFAGGLNGPFTLTLAPGAGLNATIVLSDPEGDTISVSAITPVGAQPAGIIPPSLPAPGQPLTLAWTGVALASNTPGSYEWMIDFADAVNATPVSCSVIITILDTPPQHTIAAATGGDGSPGNPYTANFTEGDGPAAGVDLCSVTDANTSQIPTITAITPDPLNPAGAGFDVALSAGLLHAAPAGVLISDDVGEHNFTVEISDGTNTVNIAIRLEVAAPPTLSITTANLPDGKVGESYFRVVQAANGTGAITFTLLSGALPAGITLNPHGVASAVLEGTPQQAETATFTLQAQDTQGQLATRTCTLTIQPKPKTSSSKEDDAGCSISHPNHSPPMWLWLAMLGAMAAAARQRRQTG